MVVANNHAPNGTQQAPWSMPETFAVNENEAKNFYDSFFLNLQNSFTIDDALGNAQQYLTDYKISNDDSASKIRSNFQNRVGYARGDATINFAKDQLTKIKNDGTQRYDEMVFRRMAGLDKDLNGNQWPMSLAQAILDTDKSWGSDNGHWDAKGNFASRMLEPEVRKDVDKYFATNKPTPVATASTQPASDETKPQNNGGATGSRVQQSPPVEAKLDADQIKALQQAAGQTQTGTWTAELSTAIQGMSAKIEATQEYRAYMDAHKGIKIDGRFGNGENTAGAVLAASNKTVEQGGFTAHEKALFAALHTNGDARHVSHILQNSGYQHMDEAAFGTQVAALRNQLQKPSTSEPQLAQSDLNTRLGQEAIDRTKADIVSTNTTALFGQNFHATSTTTYVHASKDPVASFDAMMTAKPGDALASLAGGYKGRNPNYSGALRQQLGGTIDFAANAGLHNPAAPPTGQPTSVSYQMTVTNLNVTNTSVNSSNIDSDLKLTSSDGKIYTAHLHGGSVINQNGSIDGQTKGKLQEDGREITAQMHMENDHSKNTWVYMERMPNGQQTEIKGSGILPPLSKVLPDLDQQLASAKKSQPILMALK